MLHFEMNQTRTILASASSNVGPNRPLRQTSSTLSSLPIRGRGKHTSHSSHFHLYRSHDMRDSNLKKHFPTLRRGAAYLICPVALLLHLLLTSPPIARHCHPSPANLSHSCVASSSALYHPSPWLFVSLLFYFVSVHVDILLK